MTYSEFATLVGTITDPGGNALPNAYYQFTHPVDPPFICFYYPRRNDIIADNRNYQKVEHTVLELYTTEKDFEQESNVETILTESSIVYTRQEIYLDSEQMWMIVYEFDLIITEEQNA